jgi:hypothetical protein
VCNGQRRFELERHQGDVGSYWRPQRRPRRRGIAKQRSRVLAPSARSHPSRRPIRRQPFHDLERQEERGQLLAVRSVLSPDVQDGRGYTGRLTGDDPALIADTNGFAGQERCVRHSSHVVHGTCPASIWPKPARSVLKCWKNSGTISLETEQNGRHEDPD